MTTNEPRNDSPDPHRARSDRRHNLAAVVGYEHFSSDTRYQLMCDELEQALNRHPERSSIICGLLDSLTRVYEYCAILGGDPNYRHLELVDEVRQSQEAVSAALLALTGPLTPFDRTLFAVHNATHLATEYLGRVHAGDKPQLHIGLAREYSRRAVEEILGQNG